MKRLKLFLSIFGTRAHNSVLLKLFFAVFCLFCNFKAVFCLRQDHKGICHAGCSLVAAICLRMPENGQQVAEANGVEVLTHILQRHMKTAKVVVSRARCYSRHFSLRSRKR